MDSGEIIDTVPELNSENDIDNHDIDNHDIDNNDIDNNDTNNNNDKPPPPAAAAMLIAADQVERSVVNSPYIASAYIPSQSIYSLFSWLGSSLYSLASIPRKALYSTTPEYDHEQVLTTIRKLNSHLFFLDKKIENMNNNTIRFGEKAKQLYRKKNVTGAMHQIRLKKMYDREIQKLESLKFNIETQILHMDSVEIMMVTVDTIKDTSEYYQNMNSNINISKLENTIDEMVEHRDSSTDIQSILSDINTFNEQNYDDDELLKELQEMAGNEDESVEPIISKSNHTLHSSPHTNDLTVSLSNLPTAPTHTLPNVRNGINTRPVRKDELVL